VRGLTACFAAAVAAALVAGCGGGSASGTPSDPERSAAWVDPEGEEPLVGSIAVDPGDRSVWLSTNRGLYRVQPNAQPRRVAGRLETSRGSGTISGQLVVSFAGPGEMLGSGHPPIESGLPPALGLIRSTDGGRTWESLSELGAADFHVLEESEDRLVGALYGEAQVLVAEDEERRLWRTRAAPSTVIDLAVDPADVDRWVTATTSGIYTSDDEGGSWRQRDPTAYSTLVWAAPKALYRADIGGAVLRSTDGGRTWEERGDLGEVDPAAMAAAGPEDLYAATVDGAVQRSRDGGATWTPVLEP